VKANNISLKKLIFMMSFIVPSYSFGAVAGQSSVESVKYRCELNIDSPWGGTKYDQNIIQEVSIPVSKSPLEQTVIISSQAVNDVFGSAIITKQFLGNVTKDPKTKRNKLFIGMYDLRTNDSKYSGSMFNIPLKNSDNSLYYGDVRYAHPIMSAVSDSGKVELFTGRYGQFTKTKFSCEEMLADKVLKTISAFNPNHSRELFQCNVVIKHKNTRAIIEEFNKDVFIGYSDTKRDLQPILEDENLKGFFANANVMANLYYNEKTDKTEFVLGMYSIRRLGYDPEKHEGYWIPPQTLYKSNNYKPSFYSTPEFEVSTNSDYAEIRSDMAYDNLYESSIGCKKISNNTNYYPGLEPKLKN
jgi:hypothetical protein